MTSVMVLVGSVRAGRFGSRVGDWVEEHLSAADVDTDLVDLAALSIPPDMTMCPDVRSFASRVGRADAVVVVTPEYNHGYPGPLKIAIDALRDEWRAKPVAFVSYGGLAGGLRAVEALRPVFAELNAMTIRETVSLHNPWAPADDPDTDWPSKDAEQALDQLLRVLLWWTDATRLGLSRAPYPA
jgi:NAD(P)H-dependent FMN reductase